MEAGTIAIIGMAGIFPQAANLAQFWDNIVRGRDCISEVPESRWRLADHYDPDPSAPDKTYSRWGGFIPEVLFDPVEFGIPPNVLEVTDTSQLLALIVAKRALEDAGYGDSSGRTFDRDRTGVVLGVGGGQKLVVPLAGRLQAPRWEEAMRSSGVSEADAIAIADKVRAGYPPWEENSFPGLLGNVVAGRIANRLDLGGMNCVVDAACASSLAGLRMAMAELNDGQADMMISGGVDADNSIFMYMCFSKTPAFTPGDHIRPFDAASDGMMVGEGIGMLILKRLADAERDGDRIYAAIRGLGSSSDGRFKSVYAPRAEGQVRAVTRAYANAGVPLASVGLIEAHGTGTAAGDLVEVTTLQKLFSEAGAEANQTAIGSVKSQVGHTKAAAGVAGLIKAALALQHKVLPPTINVEQPHPAGNFGQAPLYINAETRPWLPNRSGEPRRAGVSSFGFGGTNYHVVLEEHEADLDQPYRLHQVPRAILLTAPSVTELAARCDSLAGGLPAEDFPRLARASEQLAIPAGEARVGFVAVDAEEASWLARRAAEQLRRQPRAAAWELPEGVSYRQRVAAQAKVATLFPGQGSQYVNMGRELASNFPEVRHVFAEADRTFGRFSLSNIVYPPPAFSDAERAAAEERLRQTQHAQPAIGALSAAMFTLLRGRGFVPDFTAGHSFGELTALWAAGALSDGDFLLLAQRRGAAMVPPPSRVDCDAGAMLSVRGSVEDVRRVLEPLGELVLANVNSPRQMVLAGPSAAIQAAHEQLSAAGMATLRLPVSAAFHSPLVAHAQAAFAEALAAVELATPRLPVFANTTAQPYPAAVGAMADLLLRHMLEPVQFAATVENLYAAGARIFVEVGPRNVLTNLVRETLGTRDYAAIALNSKRDADADRGFRNALVQLAVAGVAIDLRDPYIRELPAASGKVSPAAVMLNGANYVSEKSRLRRQQALENGHMVATAAVSVTATPAAVSEAEEAEGEGMGTLDRKMTDLQATSEQVAGQAISLADLHRQFLAEQAGQARMFLELLSKQQDLLRLPGLASLPSSLHESLAVGLSLYHQVQAATVAAHVAFLQAQGGGLAGAGQPQGAGDGVISPPRPVFPAAAPAAPIVAPRPQAGVSQLALAEPSVPTPSAPAQRVACADLKVADARPGTGAATLQPEMRTVRGMQEEADTVSAGRGAVQGHVPAANGNRHVPLASAVVGGNGHAPAPKLDPATELLAVVSEKTGYPLETLDLGMDVEADLGIDSIKRVEILGVMQERFPRAPKLKPAELAELRTLAQIAEYLGQFVDWQANEPALITAPASPVPDALVRGVRLQALPAPDRLEVEGALLQALVVDDGTELAEALAQALEVTGRPVTLLGLPGAPRSTTTGRRLEIRSLDDVDVARGLQEAVQAGGPVGGLIYLHWPAGSGQMFAEEEVGSAQGAFFLAKHLGSHFNDQPGRPFFLAVTRLDGALGLGDGHNGNQHNGRHGQSAVAGGLFGLVKTLRLEWPGVYCRGIDVDPACPASVAAQRIMDELLDPNTLLAEVGLSADRRVTMVPAEALAPAG